MKLLESQAKALFAEAGIPVPKGRVTSSAAEAKQIAAEVQGRVVIKAQVPIGGRGKAGGIKLAQTPDEASQLAAEILAKNLRGYPVKSVLVEQAAGIEKEYYLSLTVDRAQAATVVMVSSEGGMDIEELAVTAPDKIVKLWVDASLGLQDFHIRTLAFQAGIEKSLIGEFGRILKALYALYIKSDAILAEINPLAIVGGHLVALDGKMEIDENALFRQKALSEIGTEEAEHPLEQKAKSAGLAYVKLEGEVGIIGNGAGLVMTTLDMVQRQGGKAANFLDIGGGAKAEVVRRALEIVLSDSDVRSVLINVFGGITRGDEVAKGLLEALQGVGGTSIPIVVRLAGTRASEGRAILEGSPLIPAETFAQAAQKAVELARR